MPEKEEKRRAEIVAERRAAAHAAFQRGPDKSAEDASVSIVEFRALRVEATRLHRENTRLSHEVHARADGSYASLQVQNSKLVREVSRLQQELARAGRQIEQMREKLSGTAIEADLVDRAVQCTLPYGSTRVESPSSARAMSPGELSSEGQPSDRHGRSLSPPSMRSTSQERVSHEHASRDEEEQARCGSPEAGTSSEPAAPASDSGDDEDDEIQTRGPGLPPVVSHHMQSVWSEHGGDLVEPYIRSGAFALVDAQWLIARSDYYHRTKSKLIEEVNSLRSKVESIRGTGDYAQRQSDAAKAELSSKEEALNYCLENDTLPRRNDLPTAAILGLEVLKASGCPNGGLPILVISCPWLTPYHPDPKGINMAFIANILKAFISGGQRYGVFWDWPSMFQGEGRSDPLTRSQNDSLQKCMQGLSVLYTHEYTTVLRMTCHPPDFPEAYDPLPAGANTAEYYSRGWTWTEHLWSVWPNKKTLDLTKVAKKHKDGQVPSELRDLLRLCAHSEGRKKPPILLAEYKEELAAKTMYNAKDDFPTLLELYDGAFKFYFGQVYKLNYTNLGWGDNELVQLARVLSSGVAKRLVLIHLAINQIGNVGLKALAEVITNGALPQLSMVVLQGNPGDASIVHKALEARAKERATRRHQRRSTRPTTGSGTGSDAPASPDAPHIVIATPLARSASAKQVRSPVRLIGSPWMPNRRQGPTSLSSQIGRQVSL